MLVIPDQRFLDLFVINIDLYPLVRVNHYFGSNLVSEENYFLYYLITGDPNRSPKCLRTYNLCA